MNEQQAIELATQLLKTHGDQGFEISMPDEEGYRLMRRTLAHLGRPSGPDGEFFVVKVAPMVSANDDSAEDYEIAS